MRELPQQLPDESDAAYAHFCAWLDCPDPDDTAVFAASRGVRADYIRKLRSRWKWRDRRRPVDQAIRDRATELTIEKTAQSLADRAAAARSKAEAAHAFLAAEVGSKALQAVRRLDPSELDPGSIVRLVSVALREIGPKAPTVAVSGEQVDVSVAGLEQLPPVEQTARARVILEETARQVELLDSYYGQGQGDESGRPSP